MTRHPRGLYESILTQALQSSLQELEGALAPKTEPMRPADAGDRIALHLARLIRQVVDGLEESERTAIGLKLARALVTRLADFQSKVDVVREAPELGGHVLRAIRARLPDGSNEEITEPLIPLLDTTLLTNAPGEPSVGSQLIAEIDSADRIDATIAFIRRTGVRPFLEPLRRYCDSGRKLRILTTSYTNSTELAALEALHELGASIKVSYNTSSTRLHAKAWLFARNSDFSTAYVGSSNLTHWAQITGIEWNVRVSETRNPDLIKKLKGVFESYWNSNEFVDFVAEDFRARTERNTDENDTFLLSPLELRLEPFQERLLEEIAVARSKGHSRNLLVAATGTGKTVMAAADYARLRTTLSRARLLFVAHREEILSQSWKTFRHVLRDEAFGELWVGGHKPQRFEHVFASIQSLSAAVLDSLAPEHFDVVIIDEFHHAAAQSYERLLNHLRPKELLGLTATPERSDGLPVLHWFDGRIAAELRLWDAIAQHMLSPFAYYGIHDGSDLRRVQWRRGRGYDVDELTNLLTGDGEWARLVLTQVARFTEGPTRIRALGFCVSVAHAEFMASTFRNAGVPAVAVSAGSSDEERANALSRLAAGTVNVVFSVDLFNEGIDIKSVDTILMLRPTDSPVLFLQQLGRGLRRSFGKTLCTVLDFIGNHRSEFRMERRFRALLGGTRKELVNQIRHGFPFLPAGCHLELDAVAKEVVLANVRAAASARWPHMLSDLADLARRGEPSLGTFLDETELELEDVYDQDRSWSDLKSGAGLPVAQAGPSEEVLRRACGRLLHIDDFERCRFMRDAFARPEPPDVQRLDERQRRLLRMLVVPITAQSLPKTASLGQACQLLWDHPQVRTELLELADVLEKRISHTQSVLEERAPIPMFVHARYTRIEILAAFGLGDTAKTPTWQSGVYWAKNSKTDLLAFTLDKTVGQFSPTTRYRDYAISRDLIHWESQSATREDGEVGRRYRYHSRDGSSVVLFARLTTNDRAFWCLGPAEYVSHEGELPMAITWRLRYPLPGDLFSAFAAAVA